ncbi:hypothetical protein [Pseudomonas vranovensis]|uniref:hypothetical protein n=1 Tax=Pseudomonas vranovensis TaxID=321661 RepID=UPI00336A8EE8
MTPVGNYLLLQGKRLGGASCNVIAAYYHDPISVAEEDAQRAVEVLQALAST